MLTAVCTGLVFASPVMKRRSREAAELYAQYRALYRYLRDFGRLHEKPPAAAVIWERYLVLAVVFGIAAQVIEQMQIHVPLVTEDPGFRSVYWFATPAHAASFGGVSEAFSSFSGGLRAAVVAAQPALVEQRRELFRWRWRRVLGRRRRRRRRRWRRGGLSRRWGGSRPGARSRPGPAGWPPHDRGADNA